MAVGSCPSTGQRWVGWSPDASSGCEAWGPRALHPESRAPVPPQLPWPQDRRAEAAQGPLRASVQRSEATGRPAVLGTPGPPLLRGGGSTESLSRRVGGSGVVRGGCGSTGGVWKRKTQPRHPWKSPQGWGRQGIGIAGLPRRPREGSRRLSPRELRLGHALCSRPLPVSPVSPSS